MTVSVFGPDAPSSSGFYWDQARFGALPTNNPNPVPTVPSPPTAFTVSTNATDATISFSWGAPNSDGGSAITGYTVRLYAGTIPSGTPVRIFTYDPAATSATETVDASTTYAPTITATNAVGESIENGSSPASVTTGSVPASTSVQLITQSAAGFQNCGVFLDPAVHGPGICFAGVDVGGLYYSNDYGRTWQAANDGIKSYADRFVRAVYGHPTQAGVVYALRRGGGQALYKSTNYGQPGSWSMVTTTTFANGNENNNQPRNVGKVGCAITSNGKLRHYAATGDGLWRSDNDGKTYTPVVSGLRGCQVTGVAVDPQDPTTVVCVSTNTHSGSSTGGLWVVTNADAANGTPVLTEIKHSGTSFTDGEEVAVVVNPATGHTEFYCAMGVNGVWRLERNGGTNTLANITGSSLPSPAAGWDAIDAVPYNGDVLVIIVGGGAASSGAKIWRHKSAGATSYTASGWVDCITNGANKNINDNTGDNWWLYDADSSFMTTGNQMDVGCVSIAPDKPNTVVSFQRSTPLRCDNFLAGSPQWYPAPVGNGAINMNALEFLPSNPLKAIAVTTDWEWTASTDGFITTEPIFKHDTGNGSSWSGAVDVNHGTYIGHAQGNNGDISTAGGQIIYITDGWTSPARSGTDLKFDSDLNVGAGNLGIPKSILVLFNGTTRHVIVHFQGAHQVSKTGTVTLDTHGYIAHKQGSNAATPAVDLGSQDGGNYRSRMVAFTDSSGNPTGVVFFYDNDAGIYRSNDWGASWALLYTLSAGSKNGDLLRVTGGLAAVPGSTTLYFITYESTGPKAWQLAAADTVTKAQFASNMAPMATNISQPSQICYSPDSGRLYIAQHGYIGAKLYEGGTGASFTTFTDKTPTGWASSVIMPVNFRAFNGRLYVLTDGQGAWHIPVPLS